MSAQPVYAMKLVLITAILVVFFAMALAIPIKEDNDVLESIPNSRSKFSYITRSKTDDFKVIFLFLFNFRQKIYLLVVGVSISLIISWWRPCLCFEFISAKGQNVKDIIFVENFDYLGEWGNKWSLRRGTILIKVLKQLINKH